MSDSVQASRVHKVDPKDVSLLQALRRDDDLWFARNPEAVVRIRPVMEEELPQEMRDMNYIIVHRPQSHTNLRKLEFFDIPKEVLPYVANVHYDPVSKCTMWNFVEGTEAAALAALRKCGRLKDGRITWHGEDEQPTGGKQSEDYLDFEDFDC